MSEPPTPPSSDEPPAKGAHTLASAQVMAELQKQAEILRLVQANLPICVWMVDRQGVFIHMEGKGLHAINLKPEQLLGRNIFEAYAGSAGTVDRVRRALRGEVAHGLSEIHGVWWDSWVLPVTDARGQVTSAVGVSLDVSAATHAERMLREQIELIKRQEAAIRALSTPIIEVWDHVLTLPLFGVLDSGRGAAVMENLLAEVGRKRARFAILDLTGAEAVDTGTANHLIKLIQAIRLLGAEGIITGVQPDVAQTMVSLGMNLGAIATLATLRDGLRYCIAKMREGAGKKGAAPPQASSR